MCKSSHLEHATNGRCRRHWRHCFQVSAMRVTRRCKYLFPRASSIDPRRQSPEFAISPRIAVCCSVVIYRIVEATSLFAGVRLRMYTRTSASHERTRKGVPYAKSRRAKASFLRWPFPKLTVLIGHREFRHKIPEFSSSRRQSRLCSDTRSISLLYGRRSVLERYVTRAWNIYSRILRCIGCTRDFVKLVTK